MTRQEKIQVEIIGDLLKAAGIPFKTEQGRKKHRVLIAKGRRMCLVGSPSCDDTQLKRYAHNRARKFLQSILEAA